MLFHVSRSKFGGLKCEIQLWYRCPCVILASSSEGEHRVWFRRGGAAPVFVVLQVQEVLHVDSANSGVETWGHLVVLKGLSSCGYLKSFLYSFLDRSCWAGVRQRFIKDVFIQVFQEFKKHTTKCSTKILLRELAQFLIPNLLWLSNIYSEGHRCYLLFTFH